MVVLFDLFWFEFSFRVLLILVRFIYYLVCVNTIVSTWRSESVLQVLDLIPSVQGIELRPACLVASAFTYSDIFQACAF